MFRNRRSKGGEIRDTKTLNLSRNIVSLQVLVDVSHFSPCMINSIRNRNNCCRSKKCSAVIGWFARARANLLRATLWVWWKTSNKVDPHSTFRNNFVQPLSSTRNKRFCCATSWLRTVKNGKHRPKLATKQCCEPSWGFLYMYLVFRRLKACSTLIFKMRS